MTPGVVEHLLGIDEETIDEERYSYCLYRKFRATFLFLADLQEISPWDWYCNPHFGRNGQHRSDRLIQNSFK